MTDKYLEIWDRAYDDAYGPGYSRKATRVHTETQKTVEMTRVPRGHWRNAWKLTKTVIWGDGEVSEPGEYLCSDEWPSREIAEEKANERLRYALTHAALHGIPFYLGAEFFPA